MGTFIDTMVMIGFFVLRLGVPLLLVFGVGYLLRRLDAKWEAELWQQAEKSPRPVARPTSPRPRPQPVGQTVHLLTAQDVFGQPCWDIKDCAPEMLEHCPAVASPEMPCWLARQESEGQLPKACYNCSIYVATQWPQQSWPQQMELPH